MNNALTSVENDVFPQDWISIMVTEIPRDFSRRAEVSGENRAKNLAGFSTFSHQQPRLPRKDAANAPRHRLAGCDGVLGSHATARTAARTRRGLSRGRGASRPFSPRLPTRDTQHPRSPKACGFQAFLTGTYRTSMSLPSPSRLRKLGSRRMSSRISSPCSSR